MVKTGEMSTHGTGRYGRRCRQNAMRENDRQKPALVHLSQRIGQLFHLQQGLPVGAGQKVENRLLEARWLPNSGMANPSSVGVRSIGTARRRSPVEAARDRAATPVASPPELIPGEVADCRQMDRVRDAAARDRHRAGTSPPGAPDVADWPAGSAGAAAQSRRSPDRWPAPSRSTGAPVD